MTQDTKPVVPVGEPISPEQANAISGGELQCTIAELGQLSEDLKEIYENLIDFTSHVIERVAGGPGTAE
jgi:hypothetical protein